ncbi:MAG: protein kinase, partial [Myxococcota bacterium]|nr:protein kinase [Myxococcota bacterium]
MSESVAPDLNAGRYRLTAVLGSGGMATVYMAHDTLLDVYRAIKVLAPEYCASPSIRTRFVNEARTMARLDHGNIVGVHDVGQDGDRVFMVMEMVK